jgi:hypothetical protein
MGLRHVAVAAGAAALIAIAAPVHAQVWNGGVQSRTDRGARSMAFDNGYREGLQQGQRAVRDRRPFNMNREKDYRNADDGYRREYGDRNFYRDEFRRGFAQGYREAYQRVGRYDERRGDVYRRGYGVGVSIAFRNGAADGYQKGLDDARHGRVPQPERQKWYRQGDHDYNGRDGISRDEYKNEYRRGFQEGYRRAYGQRR